MSSETFLGVFPGMPLQYRVFSSLLPPFSGWKPMFASTPLIKSPMETVKPMPVKHTFLVPNSLGLVNSITELWKTRLLIENGNQETTVVFQGVLRLSNLKLLDFDGLVKHLRNATVNEMAVKAFGALHVFCQEKHGEPTGCTTPAVVNVRILLSAFMILSFPDKVFLQMGKTEDTLIKRAESFANLFEAICFSVGNKGVIDLKLTEIYLPVFHSFISAFKEWKVPDEKKVIKRIKIAIFNLKKAHFQVRFVDKKMREDLNLQISILEAKLSLLAGREVMEKFQIACSKYLSYNKMCEDEREIFEESTKLQSCIGKPLTYKGVKYDEEDWAFLIMKTPDFQCDLTGMDVKESFIFRKVNCTLNFLRKLNSEGLIKFIYTKFWSKVNTRKLEIPITHQWIRGVMSCAVDEENETPPVFRDYLEFAKVVLAMAVEYTDYPETFKHETQTLVKIQKQFNAILAFMEVLHVLKQKGFVMGRDVVERFASSEVEQPTHEDILGMIQEGCVDVLKSNEGGYNVSTVVYGVQLYNRHNSMDQFPLLKNFCYRFIAEPQVTAYYRECSYVEDFLPKIKAMIENAVSVAELNLKIHKEGYASLIGFHFKSNLGKAIMDGPGDLGNMNPMGEANHIIHVADLKFIVVSEIKVDDRECNAPLVCAMFLKHWGEKRPEDVKRFLENASGQKFNVMYWEKVYNRFKMTGVMKSDVDGCKIQESFDKLSATSWSSLGC